MLTAVARAVKAPRANVPHPTPSVGPAIFIGVGASSSLLIIIGGGRFPASSAGG